MFHGWLLWTHLASGRFSEPAVVLRWTVGVLLFSGFLALRGIGAPVLFGRKAVVLWLLVFMLHVFAAAPTSETTPRVATLPGSVVELLTQIGGSAVAAALGLALVVRLGRGLKIVLRDLRLDAVLATAARAPKAGHGLAVAPRPPPALPLQR